MILYDIDILRAEHDILHEATVEFLENDSSDVQYICGVVDLAEKLLSKDKKNGEE